jgi:hypothetical protein
MKKLRHIIIKRFYSYFHSIYKELPKNAKTVAVLDHPLYLNDYLSVRANFEIKDFFLFDNKLVILKSYVILDEIICGYNARLIGTYQYDFLMPYNFEKSKLKCYYCTVFSEEIYDLNIKNFNDYKEKNIILINLIENYIETLYSEKKNFSLFYDKMLIEHEIAQKSSIKSKMECDTEELEF